VGWGGPGKSPKTYVRTGEEDQGDVDFLIEKKIHLTSQIKKPDKGCEGPLSNRNQTQETRHSKEALEPRTSFKSPTDGALELESPQFHNKTKVGGDKDGRRLIKEGCTNSKHQQIPPAGQKKRK